MALVTNLLGTGKVSDIYGNGAKYTVTLADLVGLGAFTTGTINLDILQAGAIVHIGRIKHSQALVGGGPLTAATVQVITATTAASGTPVNTFGAAAFNVFQAVADGTLQTFGTAATTPVGEAFNATSYLQLAVTLTGGNASQLTAGKLDVWAHVIYLK